MHATWKVGDQYRPPPLSNYSDRTGRVRYRAYMGCYQEYIGFRTPRSTPRRLSARYYTSSEASGETNSVTINRCLMGQLVWSGILGQMGWVDTLVETCGRSKGWAITLGRPMLFFLVDYNSLFWGKYNS